MSTTQTVTTHQRGMAVIAALLVVAAAAIIASSIMARQSTQVRLLQAELHRVQARTLLLGGLDWSRVILRGDGRSSAITHREQTWATAIADMRVSREGDARQAWFSGRVEDEQGKFNLDNLAHNGIPSPEEVEALTRLLTSLRIAHDAAPAIAERIARSQARRVLRAPENVPKPASGQRQAGDASSQPPANGPALALGWQSLEDLREIDGIDEQTIDMLRPYLTVLPERTALNVNTTTTEVLAALSPKLTQSAAAALIDRRDRGSYFNNASDFNNHLAGIVAELSLTEGQITTNSRWFGVVGTVRIDPAFVDMRALILRDEQPTPRTVWVQESH